MIFYRMNIECTSCGKNLKYTTCDSMARFVQSMACFCYVCGNMQLFSVVGIDTIGKGING